MNKLILVLVMSVVSLVAVSQSNIKEELIEQVTQKYDSLGGCPEQTLDIHIRILSEVCDELIPLHNKALNTYEELRAQYKGVNTKQQKRRFIRNHTKQMKSCGIKVDECEKDLQVLDKVMTSDEWRSKYLVAMSLSFKAYVLEKFEARLMEEAVAEMRRKYSAGCTMNDLVDVVIKYSGLSEEEARDLLMNMKLPFNQ